MLYCVFVFVCGYGCCCDCIVLVYVRVKVYCFVYWIVVVGKKFLFFYDFYIVNVIVVEYLLSNLIVGQAGVQGDLIVMVEFVFQLLVDKYVN